MQSASSPHTATSPLSHTLSAFSSLARGDQSSQSHNDVNGMPENNIIHFTMYTYFPRRYSFADHLRDNDLIALYVDHTRSMKPCDDIQCKMWKQFNQIQMSCKCKELLISIVTNTNECEVIPSKQSLLKPLFITKKAFQYIHRINENAKQISIQKQDCSSMNGDQSELLEIFLPPFLYDTYDNDKSMPFELGEKKLWNIIQFLEAFKDEPFKMPKPLPYPELLNNSGYPNQLSICQNLSLGIFHPAIPSKYIDFVSSLQKNELCQYLMICSCLGSEPLLDLVSVRFVEIIFGENEDGIIDIIGNEFGLNLSRNNEDVKQNKHRTKVTRSELKCTLL